jgi:hypothetical protein
MFIVKYIKNKGLSRLNRQNKVFGELKQTFSMFPRQIGPVVLTSILLLGSVLTSIRLASFLSTSPRPDPPRCSFPTPLAAATFSMRDATQPCPTRC